MASIPAEQSSPAAAQLDRWIWPNGDIIYRVPTANQRKPGRPHFGYALVQMNTSPPTLTGKITRRFYCLGVFKCVVEDCNFVLLPQQPVGTKKLGAAPPPAKYGCRLHMKGMKWIPCTGGSAESTGSAEPCTIVTVTQQNTSEVQVSHYGTHNHPRPPNRTTCPAIFIATSF